MSDNIMIECISCRECFESKKIKYSNDNIPEFKEHDDMVEYAIESGVEFDCPKCGERQELADCELF